MFLSGSSSVYTQVGVIDRFLPGPSLVYTRVGIEDRFLSGPSSVYTRVGVEDRFLSGPSSVYTVQYEPTLRTKFVKLILELNISISPFFITRSYQFLVFGYC